MAVTVAEGVVVITADADSVPGDVTAALRRGQGGILGEGDRAGRGWVDSFKGSFLGNALASVAVSAAATIGEAIGSGIRAAWDFAWDSIDVASGLSEAQTAIDQVFGDSAGIINGFAESAAVGIGQSELATLKAAQSFGIYGQAAGLASQANAVFSTDLVRLASDFASFYDTSPEQAIEAIGAGLRGESEPLRQYGVLLDDATLRQRALTLGIYDGNGSLNQQQRVLAAQAEIMAQAGAAMGDFDRTSGGLANQQRILAAQFENAKGQLGEALLPVMLQLVTFANDEFMPAFTDVIGKVGPELGDALIEVMPSLVDLLGAFVELLPPLTDLAVASLPLFIGGMKLLLPIVQFATELNTGFYNSLSGIFSLIMGDSSLQEFGGRAQAAGGVIGWFNGVILGIGNTISGFIGWIGNALGITDSFRGGLVNLGFSATGMGMSVMQGVQTAGAAVSTLSSVVSNAVGNAGSWLYSSGRAVIEGFISGIRSMIGAVSSAVGGVLDFARGFFPNSPAKRGPFSGQGWTNLKKSGGAVIDEWAAGMRDAAPSVPFDLMGIASPGGASSRVSVARDAYAPGASAAPTSSGNGTPAFIAGDLVINEATDPLGSAGRVGAELRKFGR